MAGCGGVDELATCDDAAADLGETDLPLVEGAVPPEGAQPPDLGGGSPRVGVERC